MLEGFPQDLSFIRRRKKTTPAEELNKANRENRLQKEIKSWVPGGGRQENKTGYR